MRRAIIRGRNVAVLAVLASACVDASEPLAASLKGGEATPNIQQAAAEREFPAKRRADLVLRISGSLRPARQISVVAVVSGALASADVDVRIESLDSDSPLPSDVRAPARLIASSHGALPVGDSRVTSGFIQFARPGYYRIAAVARATPSAGSPSAVYDTLVQDVAYETVWIRVAESGGRVTEGYDPSVADTGFLALGGSYGPFVRTGSSLLAKRRRESKMVRSSVVPGDISVTGYFMYDNYDLTPISPSPVEGAEVSALCVGRSSPYVEDYDLVTPVTLSTSTNGYWNVYCAPSEGGTYDYVQGEITLRDAYSYTVGNGGGWAGASFWATDGEQLQLKAANPFAARVFKDLHERVPVAFAKFGRSRSRIRAEVHQTDRDFGIFYCPSTAYAGCASNDVIYTNFERVFNTATPGDGLFVTLHEYGHGFQYLAVEAWPLGANACTPVPEGHGFTETENLGCALMEGFADFFSILTNGDRLTVSPYGGDYGLENNKDGYPGALTNPPTGGDGMRVEAAVAAFFYDLVDVGSEPDAPANTPGPTENWDTIAVPPAWLLDVLQYCRLDHTISALTGPDELTYCMEGATSAYGAAAQFSSAWRSRFFVSYDAPIGSYSAAAIRTLWRYNMYGAYP